MTGNDSSKKPLPGLPPSAHLKVAFRLVRYAIVIDNNHITRAPTSNDDEAA